MNIKKSVRMNYSLRTFFSVSAICIFGILVTGIIMWNSVNRVYVRKYAEQNVATLKQIGSETDSRISTLLEQIGFIESSNVFKRISKTGDMREFADADELFCSQTQINKMLDSIYYYRTDGTLFYSYSVKSLNRDFDVKDEPWYKAAFEKSPYMLWYPKHTEKLFSDEKEVISVLKVIYDRTETIPYGVICYNLDCGYFEQKFADLIKDGNCVITDSDGNVMFRTNEEKTNVFIPEQDYGYIMNGADFTAYCTLTSNNWRIFCHSKSNGVTQARKTFCIVFVAAIVIGVLLSVILILVYIKWYISPIYEFEGIMKRVGDSNMNIRWTPKKATKEIQEMAKGFNSMVDSISELIERVEEGNRLNTRLNAKVIEEQLNAHFLYNVLNSIYYMADSGDHEKTAAMTEALANFVRHSLNKGQSITTLAKEAMHVENYVMLEKFRYGNKFEFYEDIDSDVLAEKIPKLILQPIVENSIVHGLFDCTEGGVIRLSMHRADDYIEISVYDNGCGISEDALKKLNNDEEYSGTEVSNGIALRLLRQRLSMNYGDFCFEIESRKGEYTLVKLRLKPVDEN